jgi:hypothetical protein
MAELSMTSPRSLGIKADRCPFPGGNDPGIFLTTRCTRGKGLPSNQHMAMSPTATSCDPFQTKSRSPLENAGSIDSDVTTTMGTRQLQAIHSNFHDMEMVEINRASVRISASERRLISQNIAMTRKNKHGAGFDHEC